MATKRRSKRKESHREAMMKAIATCSAALSHAYRRPDITNDDLKAVLGAVYELHINYGAGLRIGRTDAK